ncbi:hypothetical protein [Rossellomorea sp. NPDC077527]|uniref:hypothetical protein n=1 Tax=Rossellomorea sp. NPDC077527 TaxID=3364510 RepID=UPI0037C5FECE
MGTFVMREEGMRLFRGIGLDWIGLDWIGLDWIGLDWIGLDFQQMLVGWIFSNIGWIPI